MSTVFKAYQPSLNRYVGVKVLLRHLEPPFAERFRREAQAIAQLHHPNILPIYDYGEHEGLLYFVSPYIENGMTLADLIAQHPLEDIEALRLIKLLLGALEWAHNRGIIHRDIKPSNVLMAQPNWPLLADFGIARLIDDSHGLTPPGQALGTAIYMAPERAKAQTADQRSDLYSVGIMLYEMVTGQVPFDGLTPIATLLKHVHEPPPSPRSILPELPKLFETVILKALAKDPDQRYQTAAEMAQDLSRVRIEIMRERALRALIDPSPLAHGAADPYQTDELPTMPPSITHASIVLPTNTEAGHNGSGPATERLDPERKRQFDRFAYAILAALVLIAALVLGSTLPNLLSHVLPSLSAAASEATSLLPQHTATASATTEPTHQPSPEAGLAPPIEQPAAPTEQPVAPTEQPLVPTPPPAPPPVALSTPQIVQTQGRSTIRLEDTDWLGGYRLAAGRTYGGRSATWIYGSGTDYHVMSATFALDYQPQATAQLTIEGMDSENAPRTLIRITVNDVEIFRGSNPLPDDDHPLETGTWASYTWSFNAALLQPGKNVIAIENLDQGAFSRPPFFMLDYAVVDVGLP